MFTDDKFIIPKTITGEKQLMESAGIGPDEVNYKSEAGWMDVGDNATDTTPISVSASTWTVITNDGLASESQSGYLPNGISSSLWDATNNQFDFAGGGLVKGDMVEIRFSAKVTTTSPSQNVIVEFFAAQGSGIDYEIMFTENSYKTAGEHRLNRFNGIYIGNDETLNYPAQFKIYSDDACSVVVEGFYIKVVKRVSSY